MTTDPNAPEVVASELGDIEAAAIVEHLRDQGIEARKFSSNVTAQYTIVVPVEVVVKHVDAERARKAIEEFRAG
jgi:hypothetical protein